MATGTFVDLPAEVRASEIVMLAEGKLCEDCTAISRAPHGECEKCGSKSLAVLAELVKRERC